MKLNKILMALAATAIVGCTSEDVNDFNAKQAPEDSRLIELDENFVISGVGVDGDFTRTHWELKDGALVNKFLPIYNDVAAANALLSVGANLEANAVGLCWLGQGAVGTDVYTNYQFYHFGWLNNGETEADVDKCGNLYNGALYSDLKLAAAGTDKAEADPANFKYVDGTILTDPKDDLNFNSGVYQTKNKSIFGGDYIVYYPFNEEFDEVGTIPAKAVTEFNNIPASATFTTAELGHATFRYSAPVTINGGDQAAGFGMKNLSTLVQLRVATPNGVPIGGAKIDQVVLYSKNKKLVKEAHLAADKIVAGQKGEALYADEPEGTQTIVANFVAGGVELKAADNNPNSAYITVLPTTVDDLVVLVHRQDNGTWAQVALGNTVFEAGKAKVLNVTVTAADFKTEFFAVDQASLKAALKAACATHPTADNHASVTLIGDVVFTDATFNEISAAVTDFGTYIEFVDIKEGAIVVPEDFTLTLGKANVFSDIRVLGMECCNSTATTGGRLKVKDGTTLNNVTMEATEARCADETEYKKKNPQVTFDLSATELATVAADALFDVQGGTVEVNGPVEHKAAINIAEGATLTVNNGGDLQFMGTDVVNDGTIEVKKGGHFDITDEDGNASWDDGKNMINNGKFIHNVDATVGTAVQAMTPGENSEYRCRVDKQKALDDAYVQWTACSVIEMVEKGNMSYDLGEATTHNGKDVDIEVNNTGYTTTFEKKDDKNIQIGNLTVKSKLVVNDEADGTKQRTLTVNGNMTVSADTELNNSEKITVKKNLDINNGATLTYAAAVGGLDVSTGNITVTDATFDANADGAVLIKCKNFSLIKENPAGTGATAKFGNRTASDKTKKTMEATGTISNGKGCSFEIKTAISGDNLLAWITCKKLEVGGAFPGGRPSVVE